MHWALAWQAAAPGGRDIVMIICGKRANSALTAHDHGNWPERDAGLTSPAGSGGSLGASDVIDDADTPEVSGREAYRTHPKPAFAFPVTCGNAPNFIPLYPATSGRRPLCL